MTAIGSGVTLQVNYGDGVLEPYTQIFDLHAWNDKLTITADIGRYVGKCIL
jgi:hypothetical protein